MNIEDGFRTTEDLESTFGTTLTHSFVCGSAMSVVSQYREATYGSVVVAGLLVLGALAASSSYADDITSSQLVQEVLAVARTRSVSPGWQVHVNEMHLLKLTEDCVVLSLIPTNAPEAAVHIHAELCTRDQKTIINDVTILRTNDSAATFFNENETFVLDREELVAFTSCLKEGMEMHRKASFDGTEAGEKRVPMSSVHRAIAHMNCWANFLAQYRKDYPRALDFLSLSLEKQRDEILNVSKGPNLKDLARTIGFFDRSGTLALLDLNLPYQDSEFKRLKSYFETTVYARRKLALFYPEQKELLARDRKLLEKFASR